MWNNASTSEVLKNVEKRQHHPIPSDGSCYSVPFPDIVVRAVKTSRSVVPIRVTEFPLTLNVDQKHMMDLLLLVVKAAALIWAGQNQIRSQKRESKRESSYWCLLDRLLER